MKTHLLFILAAAVHANAQPAGESTATVAPAREAWVSSVNTLHQPVPGARQLILQTALDYTSVNEEYSKTRDSRTVTTEFDGSGFGPSLSATYGVSRAFYLGADYAYQPSKLDKKVTVEQGGTKQTLKGRAKNQGQREPAIRAGASMRIGQSLRLTGELRSVIGVGAQKQSYPEGTGDWSTNGLQGGGALNPKVSLVAALGAVNLFGDVGRTFMNERKIEVTEGTQKYDVTDKGGDQTTVGLGLEFTKAANVGGRLSASFVDKVRRKAGNETATSKPYRSYEAKVYAGIPLNESLMISPQALVWFDDAKKEDEDGERLRPSVASMIRVQMISTF